MLHHRAATVSPEGNRKGEGDAVTELVRAAVHYWLKGMGKNDGLLYSREETVEAVVAGWKGGDSRLMNKVSVKDPEQKAD